LGAVPSKKESAIPEDTTRLLDMLKKAAVAGQNSSILTLHEMHKQWQQNPIAGDNSGPVACLLDRTGGVRTATALVWKSLLQLDPLEELTGAQAQRTRGHGLVAINPAADEVMEGTLS
jgi:hypothetical protein